MGPKIGNWQLEIQEWKFIAGKCYEGLFVLQISTRSSRGRASTFVHMPIPELCGEISVSGAELGCGSGLCLEKAIEKSWYSRVWPSTAVNLRSIQPTLIQPRPGLVRFFSREYGLDGMSLEVRYSKDYSAQYFSCGTDSVGRSKHVRGVSGEVPPSIVW